VEEDEDWDRFYSDIPAARRAPLDEALHVAGKILGANAPKWQRLVALCEEYLSGHEPPDAAGAADPVPVVPIESWMADVKAFLEEQNAQWASLYQADPVLVAEAIPDEHAD